MTGWIDIALFTLFPAAIMGRPRGGRLYAPEICNIRAALTMGEGLARGRDGARVWRGLHGDCDMALALYGHPFSSYTQKVLVALYENAVPFELRLLGPDQPENQEALHQRSPTGKFPMLVHDGRSIVEASLIIEYLQQVRPGPVRLIPDDALAALDVRFLDRFFDLYVMDAMQVAVNAALQVVPMTPEDGLEHSKARLEPAYAWLDRHLSERTWAAGEDFTLADCAAAPSLFYADWVYPIPDKYAVLRAYRARLLARPSFARAVDEARYFRPFFPLGAPDRD